MIKKVGKLAIATLLVGVATSLSAQTLNDYRKKLEFGGSGDPFNRAQITIREDNSARIALTELASQSGERAIEGYRIGVFFDNGASARANAKEVLEQFEKYFSDIPVTMNYDNPYFKVSAGYCISSEEAVMMLDRIQKRFPKAYLMRENITPDNLRESREKELESKKGSVATDDSVVEQI